MCKWMCNLLQLSSRNLLWFSATWIGSRIVCDEVAEGHAFWPMRKPQNIMWFLLHVFLSHDKQELGIFKMDAENVGLSNFKWKTEAESRLVENLGRYSCIYNIKSMENKDRSNRLQARNKQLQPWPRLLFVVDISLATNRFTCFYLKIQCQSLLIHLCLCSVLVMPLAIWFWQLDKEGIINLLLVLLQLVWHPGMKPALRRSRHQRVVPVTTD